MFGVVMRVLGTFVPIVFVARMLVTVFAMFVSIWILVFSMRVAVVVTLMVLYMFRMFEPIVFHVFWTVRVVFVSVLGMVALVVVIMCCSLIEIRCCSFGLVLCRTFIASQQCAYFQNASRLVWLDG